MSVQHFTGLTWDHPRGYRALEAAAAKAAHSGLNIKWDRQPLEGFESHPIEELCAHYDLIVMDHPHLGEAVELECLQPIDPLISSHDLANLKHESVGACLKSYQLEGLTWALPLDAACQVMATRSDLLASAPPTTWDDLVVFARSNPVALSLAGPHALLTCLSIAVSSGVPTDDEELFDFNSGVQAFEILQEIYSLSQQDTVNFNPIELLTHMANGDTITLCPLIFGYVNFTRPQGKSKPLTFANAPRSSASGQPGSILGGTGIGISRRCNTTPELLAHLLWLMSKEAQGGFIPAHDGQPCRRDAWNNSAINATSNNFYTQTLETIEAAYVRPRHTGFVQFQLQASRLIRQSLNERSNGKRLIQKLNEMNQRLLVPRKALSA